MVYSVFVCYPNISKSQLFSFLEHFFQFGKGGVSLHVNYRYLAWFIFAQGTVTVEYIPVSALFVGFELVKAVVEPAVDVTALFVYGFILVALDDLFNVSEMPAVLCGGSAEECKLVWLEAVPLGACALLVLHASAFEDVRRLHALRFSSKCKDACNYGDYQLFHFFVSIVWYVEH